MPNSFVLNNLISNITIAALFFNSSMEGAPGRTEDWNEGWRGVKRTGRTLGSRPPKETGVSFFSDKPCRPEEWRRRTGEGRPWRPCRRRHNLILSRSFPKTLPLRRYSRRALPIWDRPSSPGRHTDGRFLSGTEDRSRVPVAEYSSSELLRQRRWPPWPSHLLYLGDLETVPNLVDDESVRGDLLPGMEKCQANADGAVAQGRDEDGNPNLGSSFEDGSFVFEVAPQNLQISP